MSRFVNKYKSLLITYERQQQQNSSCQQSANPPSPHTASLPAYSTRPEHTNITVNITFIICYSVTIKNLLQDTKTKAEGHLLHANTNKNIVFSILDLSVLRIKKITSYIYLTPFIQYKTYYLCKEKWPTANDYVLTMDLKCY